MKKAYLKKKTTLMIDTNSDPNENGMQIANTASHQSDLDTSTRQTQIHNEK